MLALRRPGTPGQSTSPPRRHLCGKSQIDNITISGYSPLYNATSTWSAGAEW